jgi:hypothetical protein
MRERWRGRGVNSVARRMSGAHAPRGAMPHLPWPGCPACALLAGWSVPSSDMLFCWPGLDMAGNQGTRPVDPFRIGGLSSSDDGRGGDGSGSESSGSLPSARSLTARLTGPRSAALSIARTHAPPSTLWAGGFSAGHGTADRQLHKNIKQAPEGGLGLIHGRHAPVFQPTMF